MDEHSFLDGLMSDMDFDTALGLVSYEDLAEIMQTDGEKIASLLGMVGSGVRKAVGTGLQAATTASTGTRMAVGAGIGAAGGAMRDTGVNPQTGQPVGRMGNILGGAALGMAGGAAAKGAVAKGLAMPNQAGAAMRVAQGGVAKATGNQASAQAVKAGRQASKAVRKPQ